VEQEQNNTQGYQANEPFVAQGTQQTRQIPDNSAKERDCLAEEDLKGDPQSDQQ